MTRQTPSGASVKRSTPRRCRAGPASRPRRTRPGRAGSGCGGGCREIFQRSSDRQPVPDPLAMGIGDASEQPRQKLPIAAHPAVPAVAVLEIRRRESPRRRRCREASATRPWAPSNRSWLKQRVLGHPGLEAQLERERPRRCPCRHSSPPRRDPGTRRRRPDCRCRSPCPRCRAGRTAIACRFPAGFPRAAG